MGKMIFTSLPMFVCGFWTLVGVFCISVEKSSKNRILLTLFMAVASLLYAGHFVFLNRMYDEMPIFDSLYSFANLAVYPLFYLYILAMTSPQKMCRKWWVLLPAIIIGLSVSIVYMMMPSDDMCQFVEAISYNEEYGDGMGLCRIMGWIRLFAKIVFVIEVLMVLIAGTRKINEYNKFVENYYADTKDRMLKYLQLFMYLFTACSCISIVFNFLGRYRFENSVLLIAIPSIVFSVLLFGIAFIGFRQSFVVKDIEQDTSILIDEKTDEQNPQQQVLLARSIEKIVTEQKLFLQHDLRVSDIAAKLNTNRLYVSVAINAEMHISFSDYINRKRVEYASLLIQNNPQMTMYEIADLSGFASDKSFYRNFKRVTGKSPKKSI